MFAKHLLDRASAPPEDGEALTGELGKEQRWSRKSAKENGEVGGSTAWAYAAVESPTARVALAELAGASTLYVNGAPFAGDAYRYGFRGVPVALRAGRNDVYVTGIREGFSLKLHEPDAPLVLAGWDATFPDAQAGDASVLVLNASERTLDLERPSRRRILPLEAAKIPLTYATEERAPGKHVVPVTVGGSAGTATRSFEVEIRKPLEASRHTFRSRIDGSVQPYAVLPAADGEESVEEPGLVLTLHGAGVDALGHVRSYSPKKGTWIVAPTNRRPYGFDWQDWGRDDAYEVLERTAEAYGADRDRIYLTGHSMGGHGTWHLAVNDPDTFAAIAPSAGWISFDTYGKRPAGELADVWQRADGASRTLDLASNLCGLPTYILHGAADDNVPASEAARMYDALLKTYRERSPRESLFGTYDLTFVRKADAGHWWDGPESPGVDCVDWPPFFSLFDQVSRDPDPARIDWVSVDPAVDAKHFWIEVAQPLEYGKPFRVRGAREGGEDASFATTVRLSTENVRRMRIDLRDSKPGRLELDGSEQPSESGWYARGPSGWRAEDAAPPATEKTPAKSGPFKRAFDRRFVLVYGTNGSVDEDRELSELARWTSESWWYRGNGSTEIVSDREFLAKRASCLDRNVILFGNADTNAAWTTIVPAECPLAAKRGSLRLGERSFEGAGLAALCVYPRADDAALVGMFADTGAAGTRLLATVPVFVSGVGIPDYALFGPEILGKGDGGVLAAGWFDRAWRL